MEISERKKQILSAIVKNYIVCGEPIGSKVLESILINAPSSATIRNEMNELGKIGLLTQPHTSAGRVPTPLGYRFYVNSLMNEDLVSDNIREITDGSLKAVSDEERLIGLASELLSKITGLPSFVAETVSPLETVKKFDIIEISGGYYAAVLITSFGRIKSKIIRLPEGTQKETLSRIKQKISLMAEGKPLENFSPAFLQNLLTSVSSIDLNALPLTNAAIGILSENSQSGIKLNGEYNLFSVLNSTASAKELLSFLKSGDGLLNLLNKTDDKVNVIFGEDTGYKELYPTAVISASYEKNGYLLGKIGVIGQTRMSYERIIPTVKYLAKKLSERLTAV